MISLRPVFDLLASRYRLAFLALLFGMMIVAPRAGQALDFAVPTTEMRHVKWSIAEGAPANVIAIAQTPDGFIWLGTATGLYRFDGVRFEHIEAQEGDPARSLQVTALLTARDGDLWVGYDYGGVAVYRHGRLQGRNAGTPRGSVVAIVQSSDGAIWVASESSNSQRLRYYKAGKWRVFNSGVDLPDEHTQDMIADRDGTIIIALSDSIHRFDPAAGRFVRLNARGGVSVGLGKDRSGNIWIIDNDSLRRLDGRGGAMRLTPGTTGYIGRRLLFDRDGRLWVTGQERGIIRLLPETLQRLERGDTSRPTVQVLRDVLGPLSLAPFQDREGNVWVGSPNGLDRFSAIDVHLVSSFPTTNTGFVPIGREGTFLFGTPKGLYRIHGNPIRTEMVAPNWGIIFNICSDHDGNVLVVSSKGLMLISRHGISRTLFAPEGATPTACVSEGNGDWLISAYGTYRLHAGKVSEVADSAEALGHAMLMRNLGGSDILSYQALSALTVRRQGRISKIWQGRNIPVGFIKTVVPIPGGLLIGGEHGLARYDGARFATIDDRAHPFLANVTGILPRADGSTWLITGQGIAKVRSADLDAAFLNPAQRLTAFVYGRDQGLRARSNWYDMNDIVEDRDGLLWLATNRGLAWIDPRKLVHNSIPPPVVIRNMVADDHVIALESGADGTSQSLPPGTDRITIDYTALSFTDPAANKFRYRLVGFDQEWVDAGERRQANYGNLAPGTYRFQVIAANGDGVWNEQGAALDFYIKPYFYQTWWFRALLVTALFLFVIVLVRWRSRAAADRTRRRVEVQVEERERIARELHDTLLQGLQGLMMRFQAVAEITPSNTAARGMLERALERGDDLMIASRERVLDLRASDPGSLESRMASLAEDRAVLRIGGYRRPVCAPVADEILAIVGEAIANAEQHAKAAHIAVELRYRVLALDVFVGDNGVGIAPAILASGGRRGHYGLQGMSERADRIGGKLRFTANGTNGTQVHLRVPARVAYQTQWDWFRKRGLRDGSSRSSGERS